MSRIHLDAVLLWMVVPVLAAAAYRHVQRWLLRLISGSTAGNDRAPPSRATIAALAFAAAFLWLQAGGMLLGFLHLLRGPLVDAWMVLGLVACARLPTDAVRRTAVPGERRALLWPLLVGIVVFVVLLLEATVPSWFQDDLVYHLTLPRSFAMAHGYVQLDDNIFTAFPLGWESILSMFDALGSAPDRFSPLNLRLITVWAAGAAALATVGLARDLGARRLDAAWAGALLLLVPTFAQFATLCYVEPYQILLSTLALSFTLRVVARDDRLTVAAGLLAGATASVKYTGLAICAVLFALLVAGLRDREPAERRRLLMRFAVPCALAAAPFYVRNVVERGNPVFPLAFGVFGGRGWDAWRAWGYSQVLGRYGLGREWSDYLLLPFRLLASSATKSGFESSLGPSVVLGVLAALATLHRRLRRVLFGLDTKPASVAFFVLLWFLFWAVTTQQGRMFLVAVPPLLALAAAAWRGFAASRPALSNAVGVAAIAACIAWAVPPGWAFWNYQETSAWIAGELNEDALLSRMLPDTYPIERELEHRSAPNDKVWLVWMHNYAYYLRRPWRADQIFEDERFSDLLEASPTPSAFGVSLAGDRIRFVLVNDRFFLSEGSADRDRPRTDLLRRKFGEVLSAGVLREETRRGSVVLYRVALGEPQRPTAAVVP
jgi:hypothetical protein